MQQNMGKVNSVRDYSTMNSGLASEDTTSNTSILNVNEFPLLTNRNSGDNVPQPTPIMGGKPYVGMVKQPTSEPTEFTMSSEDFPALPGSQNRDGFISLTGQNTCGNSKWSSGGFGNGSGESKGDEQNSAKADIEISPDGQATNIPGSMIEDQFGIVGLLSYLRVTEENPKLVSLALGHDLTAFGLNLNSSESLHSTFGGPWAEYPNRAQDTDFHVPPEYRINHITKDKLDSPMQLSRYNDDVLFFLFYNNVRDVSQFAAASELYNRDWRYHIEEKVWMTRIPGSIPYEKSATCERGMYYFFDPLAWNKVVKEFYLEYCQLEARPVIPQTPHDSA